MQQP
jgi:hypothetical protein